MSFTVTHNGLATSRIRTSNVDTSLTQSDYILVATGNINVDLFDSGINGTEFYIKTLPGVEATVNTTLSIQGDPSYIVTSNTTAFFKLVNGVWYVYQGYIRQPNADKNYIVICATTTSLPGSPVYNNGTGGIGATLTGTGPIGVIDNHTVAVGDLILVKNESNQIHNGIYEVTQLNPYILTRVFNYDETAEITNSIVYVNGGYFNANKGFSQITPNPIVGTDDIVFEEIRTTTPFKYFSSNALTFTWQPISIPGLISPRQGYFYNNIFYVGCFSHNFVAIDTSGNLSFFAPKLPPTKESGIYVSKTRQRVYVVDNTFIFEYSLAGTLLNQWNHGVVSLKTGVVCEGERLGVVDFQNGTFRIHNSNTGAFLGSLTVGSGFQPLFVNYYDGYAYIGTNGSIRKVSMRNNFAQQTIGTGRCQKVVKVGNIFICNQITSNQLTFVDNTNFTTVVTQNIGNQPRGLDTCGYLLGIGYFGGANAVFYNPYDMNIVYTTPPLGSNCHLVIFGGNKALVLCENGTGGIVTIHGGITLPVFGTELWYDTARNESYSVSSDGTIKKIDSF